jgi:hypothetical protein
LRPAFERVDLAFDFAAARLRPVAADFAGLALFAIAFLLFDRLN